MYYLILKDINDRSNFIDAMKKEGISCVFHYVPLHVADYGRNYARTSGKLPLTNDLSDRLVRLPLWIGMGKYQDMVIDRMLNYLSEN
jgi:dTDP-4-amino-4,6-dideoxygalactose transaminase